ncbi:integrase core domain-containing protein [Corynebacterium propinquum]|uniref:integrase core domain-containing protein n=1 Tax=Corynebacterium propinquum TaxID=43769 RepID=UPI00254CEE0C|nr:integrase core domain-containing protein [Corynebacterium propinquum]MDK8666248.1 integrase core domain-containing protein [Corynebacterium propinquum]
MRTKKGFVYAAFVSDPYDNALAEIVNDSYKNELIHTRSWGDVVDVEIKPFEWVNWWNRSRPPLGVPHTG